MIGSVLIGLVSDWFGIWLVWYLIVLVTDQSGIGYVQYLADHLQTLLAALVLPPERFGKVRCCAIFFSSLPLPLLIGGLLGVGEASQLTLHPPADSPTVVEDGQKATAIRAMRPRMSLVAPSSSPHKAFWSHAWSSSLRAAHPCKEWRELF